MRGAGEAICAIFIDAAVVVGLGLMLPLPPVVALAVLPLVFAGGLALTINRWRPWDRRRSLPPAPRPARDQLPLVLTGGVDTKWAKPLEELAPDPVLWSRSLALLQLLERAGRPHEAHAVREVAHLLHSGKLKYREPLLALLREHRVSTRPDPRL